MSDTEKKNAVAVAGQSALPDFLKGVEKVKLGNVDHSDLIVPRIKLLQAISPEVEEFEEAKAGGFWHTLGMENLGDTVTIVPILVRKRYALWAPRGDERGILARSDDAIHWDPPNAEFEIKLKGVAKKIVWATKPTVAESGLAEFGSSNPEDENSQPAAALTYEILAFLPDYPDMSPVLILNTRSSVKKAKQLISSLEMRNVPHYAQQIKMSVVKENGTEGPYNNYKYAGNGFVDEDTYKITKELYDRWSETDFRANDEADEASDAPAAGGKAPVDTKGKF